MTQVLPSPPLPTTLGEVIERAARHFPERGIQMLDRRGRLAERRPFPEFRDSVQLGARRLLALGLEPGERVVVCLPTSWSFLETWIGAHLAGALPVAMAPPGAMGSASHHVERVLEVTRRLDARFLVCDPTFEREAAALEAEGDPPPILGADRLSATPPAGRLPSFSPDPEEVAFLQLTSGSTGIPRAVMIPHHAAIHNSVASSEAIGRPHGAGTEHWADTMVSWLPLYHDMGLVGGLFYALIQGLNLTLLGPRSFLARPRLWLEAVARGGQALSPAPNFAYQLAVERTQPEEVKDLDLSNWAAAMTGSEMVRPETMAAFCEAFAPCGFAPEAVRPCYGMAEATLAVTFDCRGEGVRTRPMPAGADRGLGLEEVVSNGVPVMDTRVEIVAPDERPLPAGEVGEVRVQGPGVCLGYWADPEATAEALRDGWLYTGDLGFLDRDGELYLTGRKKEILILHGQNVMPHELEWIAEGVSGGGGTLRSAAFSVSKSGQGEAAVLVLEANARQGDDLSALRHDVSSAIGRGLHIPLADLVLVRRGTIPKTSSGKLQRRRIRERYLAGELKRLDG